MLSAFSPQTGKTYPSWDDLVQAEANGYAVIVIRCTNSWVVVRSLGPFADKKTARNRAATQRKRWRKALGSTSEETVSVQVEPLWGDINPERLQ